MADLTTLRRRLLAREHLIGTFIKTPTTHATEILGALGFDFVVIDEEHAPFDRMAIDAALARRKGRRHGGAGARVERDEHSVRSRLRRDRGAGAARGQRGPRPRGRRHLPLPGRPSRLLGLAAARRLRRHRNVEDGRSSRRRHHRDRADRGPGSTRRDRRHRRGGRHRRAFHRPGRPCRCARGEILRCPRGAQRG